MIGYKNRGIFFAIFSAVLFGISPMFASLVTAMGFSSITVTFFRFILAAVFLFLFLKIRKISLHIKKAEFFKLMVCSLCSSLTILCLYSAYPYIGISTTTTLHFLYPALVAVVSVFFYKDRISKTTVFCLIGCICGLAFFFDSKTISNPSGIILALLSAICYCLYMVFIEKFNFSNLDSTVVCFYISLFNAFIIALIGIAGHNIVFVLTPKAYLYCALVSLMSSAVGSFLLHRSVRYISSITISLLSLFEPLSSTICGILFLHESFTLLNLIGGCVIFASLIILILSKEKKESSCQ